jgi:hypothetical protein
MLVGSDWYNNKLCDAIGVKRGDTVGVFEALFYGFEKSRPLLSIDSS